MQEKTYITSLRGKGQIKPRKGGGEEIISTSRTVIRFPASVKKLDVKDWPRQHRIFANLYVPRH